MRRRNDKDREDGAGDVLGQVTAIVRDGVRCPFMPENAGRADLKKSTTLLVEGPSGVGKTSLAFAMAKSAWKGGRNTIEEEKLGFEVQGSWHGAFRVALLFQEATLLDSLTVRENLKLAMTLAKEAADEIAMKTILKKAGLEPTSALLGKYPSELSVGMARRVALAVSLSQKPDILIADEPFASLDAWSARTIAQRLRELQDETGLCIVLMNHLEEYGSILKSTSSLTLTPNEKYHGDHRSIMGKAFSLVELITHHGGGLRLTQRIWSDFVRLVICSCVLCFLAGSLVGGGFMSLGNVLLQYADVDSLLKALPDSVKKNPIFAMMKGTVSSIGKSAVEKNKSKIIGVAFSYLCCIELAPLIVGLLMAGIFSSFMGGRIASMQSTEQDYLLYSLGLRPTWRWTLIPSVFVAAIAAPLLFLSCYSGLLVSGIHALGGVHVQVDRAEILSFAWDAFLTHNLNGGFRMQNSVIGFLPFIALYRTLGFLMSTVFTCEFVARKLFPSRTARDVSLSIGMAVMCSYIVTLLTEFAYSHILVQTMALPDPSELDFSKLLKGG